MTTNPKEQTEPDTSNYANPIGLKTGQGGCRAQTNWLTRYRAGGTCQAIIPLIAIQLQDAIKAAQEKAECSTSTILSGRDNHLGRF